MVNQGREGGGHRRRLLPPGWACALGRWVHPRPYAQGPIPGGLLVDDLTSYPDIAPARHGPHRTILHLLTGIVPPSCQREVEALSRSS